MKRPLEGRVDRICTTNNGPQTQTGLAIKIWPLQTQALISPQLTSGLQFRNSTGEAVVCGLSVLTAGSTARRNPCSAPARDRACGDTARSEGSFTLEVESVEREVNFMSDWIDRLKQQRDKTSADQQLEREIKLRDAQMIESKLPDFWRSVVDETEAQAGRLSHVFPSTPGYATEFSRTEDGFVLRQLHGRHLEVTATLDMGSRQVKIDWKESSPQSRLLQRDGRQVG